MQSPSRLCRRRSRWTSSMRMHTFWWSTSPKGWSSTRLPATRTAPWSTLCSGTARAAFPALAARSGPASSTASIRTPAVCWWWQRMMQPTSAFPSRWQCTAWSGPTIPSSMAALPRMRALWRATWAAARPTARRWRSIRPVSPTQSTPIPATRCWNGWASSRCWSAA